MSSETTDQFSVNYPWISNAFFEKILRREHKDDTIIVNDYTLKPALGKGENYASQMLRVRVNFTSIKDPSANHISLIVKTVVGNAEVAAVSAELNVFHKEIYTFQQIIPEVEKLLLSIGDHSRLSAKYVYCLYTDLSLLYHKPIELIVLCFSQVLRCK